MLGAAFAYFKTKGSWNDLYLDSPPHFRDEGTVLPVAIQGEFHYELIEHSSYPPDIAEATFFVSYSHGLARGQEFF